MVSKLNKPEVSWRGQVKVKGGGGELIKLILAVEINKRVESIKHETMHRCLSGICWALLSTISNNLKSSAFSRSIKPSFKKFDFLQIIFNFSIVILMIVSAVKSQLQTKSTFSMFSSFFQNTCIASATLAGMEGFARTVGGRSSGELGCKRLEI
eukprot:Lithocolla_globosa_v1_NODE_4471_length_1426_cov_3.832969.p2 type:complete len:154 gc:universal NODE_4471_length_1426_cov_3.832969:770-309(-)